jgi:hypothetical protein
VTDADVNVRGGPEEMTPLHIACRYNSVTNGAVQLLLFKGAEINARDIKGKTPYIMPHAGDTNLPPRSVDNGYFNETIC